MKTSSSITYPRCISSFLAALGLLACDPAGPGASGVIKLSGDLDARDFSTLEIRVYADAGEKFIREAVPTQAPGQSTVSTNEVTFPYAYNVGEALGTTSQKRWRMTSWLSRGSGSSDRPAELEPFCSVAFELADCGAQFGGYCDLAREIDCTIE